MAVAQLKPAAGVMLVESDSLVRTLPGLLDGLNPEDRDRVLAIGRPEILQAGTHVWRQGDIQTGIYMIESGRIRSYYAAPSGREVTLAYWAPGNFVGGPDLFGSGPHVWSSVAAERTASSQVDHEAAVEETRVEVQRLRAQAGDLRREIEASRTRRDGPPRSTRRGISPSESFLRARPSKVNAST